MSKKELEMVDETVPAENDTTMATHNPDEVLAYIVKYEDGYHVIDQDGTEGPVCKLVDDGEKTIALTKNASNRKWFNRAKADEAIAKDGQCPLTYKATKVLGPQGSRSTKMPNEKLIAYLSAEEQEEYKAIIARAIEARDADKAKPMTEAEKLEAQIAKAKAKLAQLLANAEGGNN